MVEFSFKICPSCGAEHVHTAELCADCHVQLVHWEPPSPDPDLPPARELSALLRDGPWELERLAEVLHESGIPCRIETFPPHGAIDSPEFNGTHYSNAGHGIDLCIYVPRSERERADQIIHEYRESQFPDASVSTEYGETLDQCPACQSPLAENSTQCSDCGLEFPELGHACYHCGSPVDEDDNSCANCGIPFSDNGAA